MMLDIRPVSILTRAILDTSPAWVLLTAGNGYIYPSAGLRLDGALLMAPDGLCFFDHQRCYPCKPHAPFEPIPWPVVEDEEIIEALYNVPANHTVYLPANYDRYVCETPSGRVTVSMPLRPGYHPSPRRFIDTDGSCVPVWVWEADQ